MEPFSHTFSRLVRSMRSGRKDYNFIFFRSENLLRAVEIMRGYCNRPTFLRRAAQDVKFALGRPSNPERTIGRLRNEIHCMTDCVQMMKYAGIVLRFKPDIILLPQQRPVLSHPIDLRHKSIKKHFSIVL